MTPTLHTPPPGQPGPWPQRCEQVWAMPSVFIGSAGQIWQDLHDRRSRYGLSYYVTSDRDLGQLAQVIAHAGAR